jgi:hypothetical protein
VISAIPEGDIVTVPRSRIERKPRILLRIESLGMAFGGAEAARAKGVIDFVSSDVGSQSKIERIVSRVPPLGPEDLFGLVRFEVMVGFGCGCGCYILHFLDGAVDLARLRG